MSSEVKFSREAVRTAPAEEIFGSENRTTRITTQIFEREKVKTGLKIGEQARAVAVS